ncbi:MAG: hypothetical protein IKD74_02125 [Clostridia bacterium]|nr:hypothetical protein [Clostridia bacterium]
MTSFTICPICGGSGKLNCLKCGGSGKVFWPGVQGKNYPCPDCHGNGKNTCFMCAGTKMIPDKKNKK